MRTDEAEPGGQRSAQHEGSQHQRHYRRGLQGRRGRGGRLGAHGSAGDALGWPCGKYNTETGPRPQMSSLPPFPDPCGELRAHWGVAAALSPRWAASACAGGGCRHPGSRRCHCRRPHTPHPEADTVGRRRQEMGMSGPRIEGPVLGAPERSKCPALYCNQESYQ